MAPSRRRGASRGSAAAARRQWKVGDLVLAKLKGFPAWPATVSEPQKWGYKLDLKRILVQFFGTQQIALCYASDIEPFTEEKKRSLLTKRQGKSADFVRALEEIIDSFDKAKKQDHVNDFSSGEGLASGGNSIRVQNEITGATVMQVETLTFRKDPTVPDHNSTDFPPGGSSDGKESLHEKPVSNSANPIIATYTSRKRTGGSRSRKCPPQQKVVSPETSKSLPQLASVSVQNSASLSQSSRESVGNLLSDRTREGSVWSTKCIRKTPDVAEGENWDTLAFVSNDSIEDDVSEIITADSDSCGLNDVGTVDSGYKVEHSNPTGEHLGEEVQLAKAPAVTRKKRKRNRKRASNEAANQTSVPDNGTIVEVGANNTGLYLQLMSQNGKEIRSKGDGDEHLPLLKRARVRMGEVSSSRDATAEFSVNKVEQVTSSVNSNVHCPGSIDLALNETSNTIPGGKILLSKMSDNQCFGHLADGESALPPSKRLHRALEAMSANVAEETSTTKQCTNDVAPRDLEKIKIEEQSQDSLCYRVPVLRLSSNKALEVGMGYSPSADSSTKAIESSYGNEASKNELAENMEHGNDMDILALEQNADSAAPVEEQISGRIMLVSEKQPAGLESYQTPLEQQQLFIAKDGEPENQQSNDERTATGALHVVEVVEGNMKKLLQGTADDTECDNAEPQMSILDDNHPEDGEHKPERDDQMQKEASGITFSDDHCSYKDALPMQPATEQAVEKSLEGTSPATTSVCHMCTSESVNFNQNSGSSSPKNDSNERRFIGSTPTGEEKIDSAASQKPKSVGIYSNAEVRAALSSFERMLGLLTRTRESISRATHMAMDCSMLGASRKIMDILACNLEHESSLHRRVDLFFLVDSIAQSSRGFKGVVGVFPSAVQAVLPRLLFAAAPPGILAKENRRQCLKVLRVWLDRRILPESILRQHIRDLESLCASSAAVYSRRSARTERSLDDPIRGMEGMHVDEYGSNSSFQLPGLCMPLMLKDEEEEEGSDSDGGSFEAVTPEHHCESLPATEKHTHILQDVDGELEMEDVAPFCQEEMSKDAQAVDRTQTSHGQFKQHFPLRYAPPSPQVVPPSSPPLPSSPPPSMPPPPLPTIVQPSCATRDAYVDSLDARPSRNAHNLQGGPRMNPSASNGVNCRPECRDPVDMQLYDTCKTGRAMNNGHHIEGPSYRHRSHPLRSQHHHLPPPNHLSYTHGGQHFKSRRETPPPPSSSYTHRYHSSHYSDSGRFYNNHDRMRPDPYDPYEYGENWRYYEHPYSGPRYPEKSKSPYGPPLPYGRPSREPTRLPHHQGWEHQPPRGMHHREFMHSQGPVPVSNRGPKMWRHR